MFIYDCKNDCIMIMILVMIALCLYIIGMFLHIKIIKTSIKDKEMTWKLDITNSSLLMFFQMHSILMHGTTNFIQDLYTYTGKWFCYTSKVLAHYGNLYTLSHSLIVSILKYSLINHCMRTRIFGKEKLIKIFFWINFLHPLFTILLQLSIKADFFLAYDRMTQIDRCLGDHKNMWELSDNKTVTKMHNLCEFIPPPDENQIEYTIYVCRTFFCWFHAVFQYLIGWNIFEIFFYILIFRFMNR